MAGPAKNAPAASSGSSESPGTVKKGSTLKKLVSAAKSKFKSPKEPEETAEVAKDPAPKPSVTNVAPPKAEVKKPEPKAETKEPSKEPPAPKKNSRAPVFSVVGIAVAITFVAYKLAVK